MIKTRLIPLLVLLLILPCISTAQIMRTYDVSSGISANSIKAIVQDDRGYIWFATTDGLNVFNGEEFKSYGCSYRPSVDKNISTLNIMTLLLHKDGKQVWVGTQSSSVYLFDPESETFRKITLKNTLDDIQTPNLCYSLAYDKDGKLWIGTDYGLYVYDEMQDDLSHLSTHNSCLPSNSIQCVFCDSNGTLWIGSTKGLLRYSQSTKDFTLAKVERKSFLNGNSIHITSITEGYSDNLWVGTWNKGLAILDKNTNTLKSINPSGDNEYASDMRIRSILPDTGELLWICSNYGLFKYNIISNRLSLVVLSPNHPNDNIYSSLKDREGGIWIGTFFQGIYYLSPRARQIECYTAQNSGDNLKGSAISAFHEDDNGLIYIASENGGLSLFDPSEKKFLPTGLDIKANNVHAICLDGRDLYIGTYSHGLKVADIHTGKIASLTRKSHESLPSNNIFSLLRCSDGCIYIGTDQGCSIYDKAQKRLKQIDELNGRFIYDIKEDNKGNIWFATYYNGVFRQGKDGWKHYIHNVNDPSSLVHDKTQEIYIDDFDELWICTEGGGVCRYDYQKDCFHRLHLTQGGKDVTLSVVNGILNDADGKLWISSNNGLWVCDRDGNVERHLTHEDGLQSNQYSFGATLRSNSGRMYFGGVNGFNVINSESLHESNISPTVTARIIFDDKTGNVVESATVFHSGSITLPRNVSSFTMAFECLSYNAPHKNEFAYQIDSNPDWTYTSESTVTFLNFPYGKHTIRVKARNGEGHWSREEAVLSINNLPPLIKSKVAQAIYILTAILLIIGALTMAEKRHEEKSRIRFNEIKSAQEQETYKAKIDFFTHVAHEIKTPVSLIKAPLEVILNDFPDGDNKYNLEIIAKNTDRLLSLVNQLLDFKKISSDGHQICMEDSDPKELVTSVTERFDGKALGNIKITTEITDKWIRCMLDPEAYTKIVSNLITNAVKHTRTMVHIALFTINQNNEIILHLEVTDNGRGIPDSEKTRIFDSFYQINTYENPRISGVGLGLSLVKLLVQKHDGRVYLDNSYKDGCRICVDIPYIIPSEIREQNDKEDLPEVSVPLYNASKVNLLIVEDTSDMLDFISCLFKDRYNIYKAANGKEALEILHIKDIDIIISDISMPIMNGFELLQEIRRNDMFCHIPVIMLTVESALETRIKGLEYGADAYIEKPFSTTHLIATADNLVSRRNAMLKRYVDSPLKQENESIISSRDQNWFEHLTRFINAHIQETDISVEVLADELNMSRSSFQRKLKGLTGLSPVEFVRLIRLKKAAELLSRGDYRVSEVVYMVGFNKPSYFTAMFKKQFGVLPKDFKK